MKRRIFVRFEKLEQLDQIMNQIFPRQSNHLVIEPE